MNFNFLGKQKPSSGLACLHLLPEKLILTHVFPRGDKQQAVVDFMEVSLYQLDSLEWILGSLITKHQLKKMVCNWVLSPDVYQLSLLDPPKVLPKEMREALRWQLKELIDYPPEDASIDYFSLPSKYAVREKLHIVTAQTSRIQSIADKMINAGVNLKYIDIPEFALRNINALYDDSSCYLGLLTFDYGSAKLIISQDQNMLLTREYILDANFDVKSLTEDHELVTLLQASFNYCTSQQQTELPCQLLVSSSYPDLPEILATLLSITVNNLDLTEKLNFEFVLDESYLSREYLIALGGALRSEKPHAAN